jgi:hypothetical protein
MRPTARINAMPMLKLRSPDSGRLNAPRWVFMGFHNADSMFRAALLIMRRLEIK